MRLIARIGCWFSGGHIDRLSCDANTRRVQLECMECGRVSAGWVCDYSEPRVSQHGDQMRHVILNPRLLPKRKQGAPVWLRGIHHRTGA